MGTRMVEEMMTRMGRMMTLLISHRVRAAVACATAVTPAIQHVVRIFILIYEVLFDT